MLQRIAHCDVSNCTHTEEVGGEGQIPTGWYIVIEERIERPTIPMDIVGTPLEAMINQRPERKQIPHMVCKEHELPRFKSTGSSISIVPSLPHRG